LILRYRHFLLGPRYLWLYFYYAAFAAASPPTS